MVSDGLGRAVRPAAAGSHREGLADSDGPPESAPLHDCVPARTAAALEPMGRVVTVSPVRVGRFDSEAAGFGSPAGLANGAMRRAGRMSYILLTELYSAV